MFREWLLHPVLTRLLELKMNLAEAVEKLTAVQAEQVATKAIVVKVQGESEKLVLTVSDLKTALENAQSGGLVIPDEVATAINAVVDQSASLKAAATAADDVVLDDDASGGDAPVGDNPST